MAISTKCSAKSEQIFNIYGAEYYGLSGREFKELENPFSRNKKTARYTLTNSYVCLVLLKKGDTCMV